MLTQKTIFDVLSKIIDPETKKDITGLVSGLVIQDHHVRFTLEVDPTRAKAFEGVRQMAEKSVRALPGVRNVTAVLTAKKPSGVSPSSQSLEKRQPIQGIKHIIAVASGKGGVGKSTTALNLALGLKAQGLRVGIMDADIYGPSLPRLLNLQGKPDTLPSRVMIPLEKFGLKVMSMGFLMPEDAALIWRGPMVMGAVQQMLRQVAWGDLDVLVIDMPPGTGDAALTLTKEVPLSGAVIVSTPQDIALIDVRRSIAMFQKMQVPVLGMVENMSYFVCTECGHRHDIFAHGGAKAEAEKQGVSLLAEIPLDSLIRQTSDEGQPIVISQPGSAQAQAYIKLAEKVWERLKSAS